MAIHESAAFATTTLLSASSIGEAIPPILARLGRAACADRAAFCHLKPQGMALGVDPIFECWHQDNQADLNLSRHDLNAIWHALFPYWRSRFTNGATICGEVKQFSNQAQRLLPRAGITCLALLPLSINGTLWGILWLDRGRNRKPWPPLEIRALETAAGLMANTLAHGQIKRDLEHGGLGRDNTLRKKAEQALKISEIQKQAILDAFPDRIRIVDPDMKILWANRTMATMMGMPVRKMTGLTCHEIILGRDTPCEGCPTILAKQSGLPQQAVMCKPAFKGMAAESYWEVYAVPLKDENGGIESFIQVSRNITDRRKSEDRIRFLTQELIKAQENERARIAYDLHDNLGQDLSSLKITCATLFDGAMEVPPEIVARVGELTTVLHNAISSVRDLAYDLRPPGLDELGLVPTVYRYCEDFSTKTGIEVDFFAAGMESLTVGYEIEINLYRMIQEAFNNVRKHARADRVKVRLVASSPKIILRIEDNGRGFDVEGRMIKALDEKRMGLGSMQERVRLLNGQLKIQSRLGKGTKIYVQIPYKEPDGE